MSNQKHAVKKVGIFKIYPSLGVDTFKGEQIKNGVMFMRVHGGTCKTKHKGKDIEIEFSAGMDGATILDFGNRSCKIDLRAFIEAAIDAGFLDKKIDFTEEEA